MARQQRRAPLTENLVDAERGREGTPDGMDRSCWVILSSLTVLQYTPPVWPQHLYGMFTAISGEHYLFILYSLTVIWTEADKDIVLFLHYANLDDP